MNGGDPVVLRAVFFEAETRRSGNLEQKTLCDGIHARYDLYTSAYTPKPNKSTNKFQQVEICHKHIVRRKEDMNSTPPYICGYATIFLFRVRSMTICALCSNRKRYPVWCGLDRDVSYVIYVDDVGKRNALKKGMKRLLDVRDERAIAAIVTVTRRVGCKFRGQFSA